MGTKTIGFAVEEADRARLDRLVKKYAGGNRSAFLRVAIAHMETIDRAERLRKIQAYGAERSARRGISLGDAQAVVHKILSSRRRG